MTLGDPGSRFQVPCSKFQVPGSRLYKSEMPEASSTEFRRYDKMDRIKKNKRQC
jgi:hypothetical protein